jgi:hypothetical protein
MSLPVRLSGVGIASSFGEDAREAEGRSGRLRALLSSLARAGSPVRLVNPIEEVALLAAYEALSGAGIVVPLGGEGAGIAMGVEEGIDPIKADYYRGILRDGPLGASPLTFPFTAPNTIAARISIVMDLRGENHTVCGGSLSGAQAIGLALDALRQGRSPAMLAGGVTSVTRECLDALSRTGRPAAGRPGCGACMFLLEPQVSVREERGAAQLLGYAEGFGRDDVGDAIGGCLEDAGCVPERIGAVRAASIEDLRPLVEALGRMGVSVPVVRSPSCFMYSAGFPMAIAEAAGRDAGGWQGRVLVVGTDCLAGASAALVRRGGA